MNGLYALKPWYAARLGGVRDLLVRRRVSPDAISAAGVAAGACAGAALALIRPGPIAGLLVTVFLAARLACANLDGEVARSAGAETRRGAVLNELGDRLAEFAVFAGCLAIAPAWLVATAALAATMPSWVALAGASSGAGRPRGGPVGKTERCLLFALIAWTGLTIPLLWVLAAGSLLTAALRLRFDLDGPRRGGGRGQVIT